MSSLFRARPKQEEVLAYRAGKMGVAAVPGSGKTTTLAYLAAQIVAAGGLGEDQEVLIVTLVNSAVENFAVRVAEFVQAAGLLPQVGYRVRTLHGLAHDIVRERPDLAGVSEGFEIVDELAAERILRSASESWARRHAELARLYLREELSARDVQRVQRRNWPNLVHSIGHALIRQAKDARISAPELESKVAALQRPFPLMQLGAEIYRAYEGALALRGALDFDDLIQRALTALQADEGFLKRLRHRWPYILEDEAQDSSRLQEEILRLLAGDDGNWVRVGDPNQAIFETFTTASPTYLRSFLREADVTARSLPNSGRSTHSIMRLANYLVEWARRQHPVYALREALAESTIEPVPEGDPQPNPADDPGAIHLVDLPFTPEEELAAVADSLRRWLAENPNKTVAALVPRNERGFALVERLKRARIPHREILKSSQETRQIAQVFADVLRHLAEPSFPQPLGAALKAWLWSQSRSADDGEGLAKALRRIRPERFIWPVSEDDWPTGLEQANEKLRTFQALLQEWHHAVLLPIDQLLLTMAQDLTLEADELALAYKMSVALRRIQASNPTWGLKHFAAELEAIAKNQRRFLGFSDLETAFDPDEHPGEVVVSTVHKAKGLEWDRVYLLSVNNYDYPSAEEGDAYIAEPWFLREGLNLQAEALAQFELLSNGYLEEGYMEGRASEQARIDYAAERLRLLYVGITRARSELVITYNTGRRGDMRTATPLQALMDYWREESDGAS